MSNFDDEFEKAPDASFDDEFDKAPEVEEKPILKPGLAGAFQSVVDTGKDSAQYMGELANDFAVGAGQGMTLGAGDEIGAVGATALEKLLGYIPGTGAHKTKQVDEQLKAQGFSVPEQSLQDTYVDYQKGSEKEFDAAYERSPVMNIAGNIAGSIPSGIALGAKLGVNAATKAAKPIMDIAKDSGKLKAGLELLMRGGKNAAVAAPALAVESAMNSKNNLVGTDAQPEELGKDVLDNMAFGIPAMLGMQGLSDVGVPMVKKAAGSMMDSASEFVDKSPMMRKAKKAYEFGTQGINPVEEASKKELLMSQPKKAQELLNDIKAADKKLGQEVGDSIRKADEAGDLVDLFVPVKSGQKTLADSYNRWGDTLEEVEDEFGNLTFTNARGRKIFQNINDNIQKPILPSEAKMVLDDVDAFIGKFKKANDLTVDEQQVLDSLILIRKNISNSIKNQVKGYKMAATRFEDFRSNVPETILAGEKPADIKNVFMGNLRNTNEKLYDKLNTLAVESSGQGSGVENAIKAMGHTEQGMKQFAENELKRGTVNPMRQSPEEFSKTVRDYSDEAQMLRDLQTVKSPSVTGGNIVSQTFQMGKAGILSGSNIAGRVAKPITNLSKKVYNMPAEKLGQYATRLQEVPGLKMYGKALQDGLQNGDQAKKNAALFSIMQNPSARIIFNDEDEE